MSDPTTLNLEPGTLNSASPASISPSLRLPPTERDFEIYEAIHIAGLSTRCQADKHRISQTRVRQIVRRVVEWLGAVLPPQTKVAKEQETHLARQIAADRFQHQLEQMTTFWDMTQESKYASIRIRLTTAQARLGAVGGLLAGLAADCLEGLPVPVWNPIPEADNQEEDPIGDGKLVGDGDLTGEGEASAEPVGQTFLSAESSDPSDPTSPNCNPHTAINAFCNLQSAIPTTPPPGDCSHSNGASSEFESLAPSHLAANHEAPATCNTEAADEYHPTTPRKTTPQPLLTSREPRPVTVLQINPNHPGSRSIFPEPRTTD